MVWAMLATQSSLLSLQQTLSQKLPCMLNMDLSLIKMDFEGLLKQYHHVKSEPFVIFIHSNTVMPTLPCSLLPAFNKNINMHGHGQYSRPYPALPYPLLLSSSCAFPNLLLSKP